MTTNLTVSGPDRDGVIVEMDRINAPACCDLHRPADVILGVTLTPDEARAIATQLNEAADHFEADEYRFESRVAGEPQ